jgi:hypothetical protein
MSAFGGKADIIQGAVKSPLIAINGHSWRLLTRSQTEFCVFAVVFPSSHPWQLLGVDYILHSLVRIFEEERMKFLKSVLVLTVGLFAGLLLAASPAEAKRAKDFNDAQIKLLFSGAEVAGRAAACYCILEF